jgi:hypothetical protein
MNCLGKTTRDRNYQLHLGLLNKVVFVDWHGVISKDPFWRSIMENENHPLVGQLKNGCNFLFRDRQDLLAAWMKGEYQATEIVKMMAISLDRRFSKDFLVKRLHEDCRRMRCNSPLIGFLREAKRQAFVVLATDNMDCFFEAYRHPTRSSVNRRTDDQETLMAVSGVFDEILCSYHLGALKSENPISFFGPWLSWHSFSFESALLIDDREDNCDVFRKMGGRAVRLDVSDALSVENAIHETRQWLDGNYEGSATRNDLKLSSQGIENH